jgi:hypothetical protein
VGTVLIGLSPFLLGNFKDTVFSLLTYRGALPVAGGSFWGAFASTSLGNIPRHFDAEVFMLAALLILGFVLFHTRRVHLDSAKLCGLLALTTICVPIFSKTTWGYYLLDPYVFVTIWALSRPGPSARRFVAPALLTILSVVLAFSRPVVPAPLCQIVEGVVISALLGGVLIWLVVDYIREAPRLESSPSAKS